MGDVVMRWTDRELLRNEVDVYTRRLVRDGMVIAYVEGYGDTWAARDHGGRLIEWGPTEAVCMDAAEEACR